MTSTLPLALCHCVVSIATLECGFQPYAYHTRFYARKKWLTTWLEYVTWYGLHQIRTFYFSCEACYWPCVACTNLAFHAQGWKPHFKLQGHAYRLL